MSAWLGREQAAYSPRPRCALPSPERVGGACRSPACAAARSPVRTASVAGVRAPCASEQRSQACAAASGAGGSPSGCGTADLNVTASRPRRRRPGCGYKPGVGGGGAGGVGQHIPGGESIVPGIVKRAVFVQGNGMYEGFKVHAPRALRGRCGAARRGGACSPHGHLRHGHLTDTSRTVTCQACWNLETCYIRAQNRARSGLRAVYYMPDVCR